MLELNTNIRTGMGVGFGDGYANAIECFLPNKMEKYAVSGYGVGNASVYGPGWGAGLVYGDYIDGTDYPQDLVCV